LLGLDSTHPSRDEEFIAISRRKLPAHRDLALPRYLNMDLWREHKKELMRSIENAA